MQYTGRAARFILLTIVTTISILMIWGSFESNNRGTITHTIDELHRSNGDIQHEWPPRPEAGPMELQLHTSLEAYHRETGMTGSAGYTLCRAQGPLIVMPLETPGWFISSSRPAQHEMVHATMCRSLGQYAYAELPTWFHEGEASAWEIRGIARLPDRALDRVISILFNTRSLPEPREFCQRATWENARHDPREIRKLYLAAREFAGYLKAQHHPEILQVIAGDVQNGMTFSQSSNLRLGGECPEIYGRWLSR